MATPSRNLLTQKHKNDLYSAVGVEEDSLPNEAAAEEAAKARSDDDTSSLRHEKRITQIHLTKAVHPKRCYLI